MIGAPVQDVLAIMPDRQPARLDQRPEAQTDDPASTIALIRALKAGDETARETLCARYIKRLQTWAHGRLPTWARGSVDTHDLVQETLAQVVRKIDAFEPAHPGAFQGYVFRTMINKVLDEIRKAQRRPTSEVLTDDHVSSDPSPFEAAVGEELRQRYDAALFRLSAADREIVVARIELGLSWPDVQEATSKPSVAATQMALSRALVKLAREMSHERRTIGLT